MGEFEIGFIAVDVCLTYQHEGFWKGSAELTQYAAATIIGTFAAGYLASDTKKPVISKNVGILSGFATKHY